MPLDVRNDIRSMDAGGVPRAEVARRLRLSRNTVARYADMVDMSPEPPLPADRPHPAIDPHIGWIDDLLEADLGAPRKQRHTAKRIYDRLVEERGYEGSYSSVQRHVRKMEARARGRREGRLPRARVGAGHRPGRLRQLRGGGLRGEAAPEAAGAHPAPLERALRRRRHVAALRMHVRGPGRHLRVDRALAARARARQRYRSRPARPRGGHRVAPLLAVPRPRSSCACAGRGRRAGSTARCRRSPGPACS